MKKISVLFFSLLLASCASHLRRMHHQIDVENGHIKQDRTSKDNFSLYRTPRGERVDEFRNQAKRTLDRRREALEPISTKNTSFYNPAVKRQYRSLKRRFKSDDLVDQSNTGSLWSARGQDNFLFAKNKHKKAGDIVILNVQNNLRTEIRNELARAFPNKPKAPMDDEKKEGAEAKAPKAAKPPEPAKEQANVDENKIWDKISTVIVEEVNKDHLLLRGRKDLIYKKDKKTIEVQALISRRELNDEDTVNSTSIVESNVAVLR